MFIDICGHSRRTLLSLQVKFPDLCNVLFFTISRLVFAGEFGASDRNTMPSRAPSFWQNEFGFLE
jgi:hypothetical protein